MIVNDPATVAEVQAAFQRYEQGLIDADAAALDELFWNSPLTIRYGDGQIQHGHAPIKAFNARRRKLGPDRALAETVVTTFGHDFATVSTLYVDVPPGKIGRQMQTWARLDGAWHVVAAHVSVVDAVPVDRGG
jgi:hypothetical protein